MKTTSRVIWPKPKPRKPRNWSSRHDTFRYAFRFEANREWMTIMYNIGQPFFWHVCAGHRIAAREIGKRLIQWADWAEARAGKETTK